jgi:hypothetical protein
VTVYTVHERAVPALTPAQRAAELVFVREGFSWPSLLTCGIWLLFAGMWLEFLAFLAAAAVTGLVLFAAGVPAVYVQTILMFSNLLLAFEAANLRRWHLEQWGYKLAGIAAGRNQEEAEQRFFDRWLPGARADQQMRGGARPSITPSGTRGAAGEGPVIGFGTDWEAKV